MNPTPLPITVISGYTGAGKSTLIAALLANDERIGVMTFGASGEQSIEAVEHAIVEHAGQDAFDAIVIEAAASVNPLDFAKQLAFGDDDATLAGRAHLDTFVTVIDASRFLSDYA